MASCRRRQDGCIEFSLWAPNLKSIEVISGDGRSLVALEKNHEGVFKGICQDACPFQYFFLVDGERQLPDPCSLFLPDDVHGPSELPKSTFQWSDDAWEGVPKSELCIYELHVGTFSDDGTYSGCQRRLDYLCELGITAIEFLPLAQCPGRWNWGYDAVGLFAPSSNYGTSNELKRLIDDCHGRGISVIHDVVYNHVGPEGNYLGQFGNYFSSKHGTPWGSAFDFDGPGKQVPRSLVIENALYWLEEFHFDGLRLDAVHYMFDDSGYTIQQEICDRVSEYEKQAGRKIHLIGEANIYDHKLIVDEAGGRNTYGAIWADDLMHAVYSVAEAGSPVTPRKYNGGSDVNEALQNGYLYEGPVMKRVGESDREQTHGDQRKAREYLSSLIVALQTHDSIGNQPQGKRLHQLASVDFQMAAAPLFWLYPAIPMMFMGEEFAADSPFMFFADFLEKKLRRNVNRGRRKEFPDHDWSNSIQPSDERAFFDCKLKFPDGENQVFSWYRNLIELRKTWQQAGFLRPENLEVVCVIEKGIFGFNYQLDDKSAFVVAQLTGCESPQLSCEISLSSGAVLLDSRQKKAAGAVEGPLLLQSNHAIAGDGRLEI